jgi:glycosyltransferase involved in cell wall biosynthesis
LAIAKYPAGHHIAMSVNISILLATYNGTKYLPELLTSLEAQTYRPLEVVCCDDVSSDGTVALLESFASRSCIPFKIFVNKENKGYTRNFLEGFHLCSGDYVALCDQDDVWKREKLEVMASRINSDLTPSMVFSNCELVDSELNPLNKTAIDFSKITRDEKEKITRGELLEILIDHPLIPGMCMMLHRERTIGNLPNHPSLMHDYALSAGFSIGGDYSYVDQSLVYYRQHSGNAIGMKNSLASKTKNKREPIWSQSYADKANKDLTNKFVFYSYLINFRAIDSPFLTNHSKTISNRHTFSLFRINRRSSVFSVFFSRFPCETSLTSRQRRKFWLKDFRTNIRLKINSLILSIIQKWPF